MMTKGADFRNRLKLDTARPTVINWPEEVTAIADGYRNRRGVPHGVQKDAIQNGWDARVDKRRGSGWAFSFKLEKSPDGVTYLSFTDSGTTGLTGRVLQPEELEEDLPPEERWGRFENVAFKKGPSEQALGSRGRGKFIFMAASKDYTAILYDSLRQDGTYRFGYRTVKKTDSPVVALDEEEGRRELERITRGFFQSLSSVGTCIIIVNPIDELVEDIESGRFLGSISETWWEILTKYKAEITVSTFGKVEKALPPVEFKLPERDSRDFKVWLKENLSLPVDGERYRIKRLHFVYRKGEPVPEDLQGIAIQRGGMKVTALPMRWVSKDIAERVYGYVTLERDLELAMLEDEGVEHYSYDFKRALPKALKRVVENELAAFGRAKLGLGVDPERIKRETENQAEKQAVYAINRIARKLGLAVGRGSGGNGGNAGDRKPLRIEFVSIRFPRESRRVNYGEAITNIRVRVVNQTDNPVEARLKLYLLWGDQTLESYLEEDIPLSASTASQIFGPFNQEFSKADFPRKGKYTIRGKLISLMKPQKGLELHTLTRHFYLEEDPPTTGLFEKCEGLDYPKERRLLMGEAIPGEFRGYILQYNEKHPAKRAVEDDLDDLKDYFVLLMANAIPWITIRGDKPGWFDEDFDKDKMDDAQHVAERCPWTIGRVLYEYYQG